MLKFSRIRLLCVGSSLALGSQISAQTLFVRRDTTPNYQAYHYFEECRSAMDRLMADVDRKDRLWKDLGTDTVLYDPLRDNLPRAAKSIAAGKQCMTGVDVDTLQLRDAGRVVETLLMADRDADVERYYRRHWDSGTAEQKDSVRSGAIFAYLTARPMRVNAGKEWYERWLKEIKPDLGTKVAQSVFMVERLRFVDSAFARKLGWQAVQMHDSLSIHERAKNTMTMNRVFEILDWLLEDEGLDSLSRSTSAYRAFVANAKLKRVYGDTVGMGKSSIGKEIPRVAGDFIYRYTQAQPSSDIGQGMAQYTKLIKGQDVIQPVPRRVNLVVFLHARCHSGTHFVAGDFEASGEKIGRAFGMSSECLGTIASLRRMKERFPQLEITVVMRTFGSLGNSVKLQPADEADTLAKYFLGFHRIPGTLVVSNTEFFRIPGFDNRRLDERTTTERQYLELFGNSQATVGTGRAYVVDQAGQLFYSGKITKLWEFSLAKKLEAVFSRSQ